MSKSPRKPLHTNSNSSASEFLIPWVLSHWATTVFKKLLILAEFENTKQTKQTNQLK